MKVKKQHLQLAIAALVIAVVWSAWSYTGGSDRRPAPASGAGGQRPLLALEQSGPAPSVGGIDPVGIPAPPSIDGAVESGSARDPFLFGGEDRDVKAVAVPAGAEPIVRSILFSSGRRLALVDNRIVGAGATVGDLKVIEIDRDAVIFMTAAGERRRIALKRPESERARR